MIDLNWIIQILSNLWSVKALLALTQFLTTEPTTALIVFTGLIYILSSLIFSGYLFGLIGRMRGTVLSQIGFTPLDILLLMPVIIFTVYRLGKRLLWLLFQWVCLTVAFLSIPIFFAGIISLGLQFSSLPLFMGNVGLLLYLLLLTVGWIVIFSGQSVRQKIRHLIGLGVLQLPPLLLMYGATQSASSVTGSTPPPADWLFYLATLTLELNVLLLLTAVFTVVPITLGKEMAEQAKSDHLFHIISALVVEKPLPPLTLFGLPSSVIEQSSQDVYVYGSTTPKLLFLIASFPSVLIISQSDTGKAQDMRELSFIKRDLILSYDISPAPAVDQPQGNTWLQRLKTNFSKQIDVWRTRLTIKRRTTNTTSRSKSKRV